MKEKLKYKDQDVFVPWHLHTNFQKGKKTNQKGKKKKGTAEQQEEPQETVQENKEPEKEIVYQR